MDRWKKDTAAWRVAVVCIAGVIALAAVATGQASLFEAELAVPILVSAITGLAIGWLAREAAPDAGLPREDQSAASIEEQAKLLAELSHALRTPLNSVIGFSEIMRGEMLGPLGNPRYRDYAGHIKDDAQLILARVDDLVQPAGLEKGRPRLRVGTLERTARSAA